MKAKSKYEKAYVDAQKAARKAISNPDGSITSVGVFILGEYASSVQHGTPNSHHEKLYAGTPLENYMKRCRENESVAEFWSR